MQFIAVWQLYKNRCAKCKISKIQTTINCNCKEFNAIHCSLAVIQEKLCKMQRCKPQNTTNCNCKEFTAIHCSLAG